MSGRLKWNWAKHQKRWFAKWHVYLGIIAGFIVSIVGITGSILVFDEEIDRALNPDLLSVEVQGRRMELDEVVTVLKSRYPEMKFTYIGVMDDAPKSPYMLYDIHAQKNAYINPYTGARLGVRDTGSSFIGIVTSIHRTLLIPVIGRYIVGLSSLCLLILTISGLRLWIPDKWKKLKSMLTVKFSAGFKRQNYDWHNVLGFYSAPVVSLLSLTGFCITFSILVVPLLFLLNGQSPKGLQALFGQKSAYHAGAVPMSIRDLAAIGHKLFPSASLAYIQLPADSLGTYTISYNSVDISRDGKRDILVMDQYTGKVLLNSAKDFPNIGYGYSSWLTPLHYGSFGGLPTKILAFIGGLIPLLLFITGFIIWWPRLKKQRDKKPKPKPQKGQATGDSPTLGRYFSMHFCKGLKYAGWFILLTFLMGGGYGLISGIPVQPGAFAMIFTGVLVLANFFAALLTALVSLIFLAPFHKARRPIFKYFALSLAFTLVFIPTIVLINLSGLTVF